MRSIPWAIYLACQILMLAFATHTLAEEEKKVPPNANSQHPLLAQVLALNGKGLPPDPIAEEVGKALTKDVDLEYRGTPIREVIEDLRERFNLPIRSDEPALAAAKISIVVAPFTINRRKIPLFVGLHETAKSQDLTFHYRYHTIWLTTPKAAKDWKDPAGTLSLKPAKESPLEKALGEPVGFDFLFTPLADLPAALKKQHGFTADISAVVPRDQNKDRPKAKPGEKSLPLRDALGILFTLEDCRCHEKDGVLVIERREKQK